jgi:phenylalanyl-tRNA synthetase beta chain
MQQANIVLNMVVTMFSQHCETPFTVEPVDVVDALGNTTATPDLGCRTLPVGMEYVNRCTGAWLAATLRTGCSLSDTKRQTGLALTADKASQLLHRMQLSATPDAAGTAMLVSVPPTRPDVLNVADVMEDVAIAYGFNNITSAVPATITTGRAQPLNTLSDLLRVEVALAGFTEVLTWVLCSAADNFDNLGLPDDGTTAAVVANPASIDVQAVRVSLLPGVLRTLGHNKDAPLPIRLFELGDVVLLDPTRDVGARNVRRLLALTCNTKAGFEVVHGLLDRLMEVLNVPAHEQNGYHSAAAQPVHAGPWLPGRVADVTLRGKLVGRMGVVHPDVLARFDVVHPCSALELDIEPFL